jgi:hypothetical protein
METAHNLIQQSIRSVRPSEPVTAPLTPKLAKSLIANLGQYVQVPENPQVNRQVIESLWLRMSEMFGHKWISSYGSTPTDTWLAGLIGFSKEDILEGIIRCMSWEEPWPPTLAQFRQLCGQKRKFVEHQPEPQEVIQARKAKGLIEIGNVKQSMAYQEWLQRTSRRTEADFDGTMAIMRANIELAKLTQGIGGNDSIHDRFMKYTKGL